MARPVEPKAAAAVGAPSFRAFCERVGSTVLDSFQDPRTLNRINPSSVFSLPSVVGSFYYGETRRFAKYASVPIPIHNATAPSLSPRFRSFTTSTG
jgi:hypothetical protein